MDLYFKSFFYTLILFFPGSQASIMAFEAMVTLAAALAKRTRGWEGFFLYPSKHCKAFGKIKLH